MLTIDNYGFHIIQDGILRCQPVHCSEHVVAIVCICKASNRDNFEFNSDGQLISYVEYQDDVKHQNDFVDYFLLRKWTESYCWFAHYDRPVKADSIMSLINSIDSSTIRMYDTAEEPYFMRIYWLDKSETLKRDETKGWTIEEYDFTRCA